MNALFPLPPLKDLYGTDKKKKLAKYQNSVVLQNQLAIKTQDAFSRYDFEGLPDTIDERYSKLSFIYYPGAVIMEKEGHVLMFPAAPSGNINPQGNPGKVWWYSANGQAEEIDVFIPGADDVSLLKKTPLGGTMKSGKKAVFIRENPLCFPFFRHVFYYSLQIADTMRTLEVSRRHIKRPYLIAVRDNAMKATIEKQFDDMDSNVDTIISMQGLYDANSVNIMPFNATPENLNACTELIEWYESKFRELCGIDNNAQMDKKGENLISDEIAINDDYTDMKPQQCIDSINRGLKIANALFGTNIKCVPRKKEEAKDVRDAKDISGDKSGNSRPLSGD